MIPLHSMFLTAGSSALPTLLKAFGIVVLLLSFAVGFTKGFRRVSWVGLTWAFAGGVFVLIGKLIPTTSNVNFAIMLLLAMAVIAATCGLFGALGHYLRPKMRWVKDDVNGDTSLAEFGLEFEPEYIDYDGEHDYAPYGKRLHKTGFGPPCFFFRMLGGLTCMINTGIILWVAYSLLILTVNATGLANGSLGVLIQGAFAQKVVEFAKRSTFEILAIGIIMRMAVKGYKNGMMASIRALIVSLGGAVAFGCCFYLPFSPLAASTSGPFNVIRILIERWNPLFVKVPFAGSILGRVATGASLFCIALVALWLINMALDKCCIFVESTAPTRIVDSVVAFALYLIIGTLLCVGILFLLAGLDYFGIFNVTMAINEGAHLTDSLIDFAQVLIRTMVAPYIL